MNEGDVNERARRRPRRSFWGSSGVIVAGAARASKYPNLSIFLTFGALYLATATYGSTSYDVVAAEMPAWALANHGTLDLSAFPHYNIPWFFEHNGGLYSDRFPGAIFYLVPAYWIASLFGARDFSMVPGSVTAALVAAATVVVLRQLLRRVLPSGRPVWVGTAFVGLGTGIWSIAGHAPWSHTLNGLLIALALWALSSDRPLAAGIPLGLSVATRPTMAVAVLVIVLVIALHVWRGRRSILYAVLLALGVVPGVAGLFIYNGLMFDRWGPSNGHELGGEIGIRLADLPLNVTGAILSPTRGLVIFYPVVLVAALALAYAWRCAMSWERAAALGALAALLTQLALNRYSGGDTFFGPRLLIEPLVLSSPLLARAVLLAGERYGHRVGALAMAVGVAIHGFGGLAVHAITGT